MSQFPPFAQFSGKRDAVAALQQQIQLEHFTDAFVEARQGSCWVDGKNVWLLEPDERREFTARADEIIAWRFAMERRGKLMVILVAPPTFLLLDWLLSAVVKLADPWPKGIAVAAVVMIAFAASAPIMIMDWRLKALRQRMRQRMRGRSALPTEVISERRLRNPWLRLAQILAAVTVVVTIGLGLATQPWVAMRLGLPTGMTEEQIMQHWATPWVLAAVPAVWLLFGLSRIRRWRNGRKEAKLKADRQLAAMELPCDETMPVHGMDHPLAREIERLTVDGGVTRGGPAGSVPRRFDAAHFRQ